MNLRATPLPPPTSGLLAAWRARVRRWFVARLRASDTVTLTQRTVYILPTRAGLMLGATLAVLLIASINYQLNLGYLLTFLLAGSALAAMHVGHANLRGLTLHLLPTAEAFALSPLPLEVQLSESQGRERQAIAVRVLDELPRAAADDPWVWTDVPARGSVRVHLAWRASHRGRVRPPALSAQTHYPLGIFRVWTVWQPAAPLLVYPAPEAHAPPLPAGQATDGVPLAGSQRGGAEFDGVRAWRRGDPLRNVVWKKWARSGELVSRDHASPQSFELWLEPALTGLSDREAMLSRLCAWVLAADRADLLYGLRLDAVEIAPGRGPVHRRACLEALATC